jgi:signal transduction histidine kinase
VFGDDAEVLLRFNELATQMESILQEQRSFSRDTSRELSAPLTTIRSRSEALREDGTLATVILPYNHAGEGRGNRSPVR